jgi:MFS family permease
VVSSLQGIATGGSIGSALATDLVPRESLGKGLAVFGSAGWIGGVIGFGVAGYSLQNLGFMPTLIIGGCLALVVTGLLIPHRTGSRKIRQPGD